MYYQDVVEKIEKAKYYTKKIFIEGFRNMTLTTLLSPLLIIDDARNAKFMKDKTLSFGQRMKWVTYCKWNYRVNPHSTYREFMKEYDGKEKLTNFLDRKLRELKPVEFPLYG